MSNQYKDFIDTSNVEIQSEDTNHNITNPNTSNEFSEINMNTNENISSKNETKSTDVSEIGEGSGIIESVLHTIDDIVFYGRSYIENNLFNISDNEDFSIVFPNLYISNYSTTTNKQLLKDLGITHIITALPQSFTPLYPNDFQYLHIPAYDDEWQDLSQYFETTNKYIVDALNNNGRIILHCMAGRSRSITLLISFLINVMKGCYNYSGLALINNDDKINILEYRQLLKSIKPNKLTYIDGVGNNNTNTSGNTKQTTNNNDNEEKINKVEQEIPKLSRKEENFIIYKKQNMINDLETLCSKYSQLKKSIIIFNDSTPENEIIEMSSKFAKAIMKDILTYVCKYRPIAEPNTNFIKQLKNILL